MHDSINNMVYAKRMGKRYPSVWSALCFTLTGTSEVAGPYVLLNKAGTPGDGKRPPYLALPVYDIEKTDTCGQDFKHTENLCLNMAAVMRAAPKKIKAALSVQRATVVHREKTPLFAPKESPREVIVAVMDCGKAGRLPDTISLGKNAQDKKDAKRQRAEHFVWVPLKNLTNKITHTKTDATTDYAHSKTSPFSVTLSMKNGEESFRLSPGTVYALQKVCAHFDVPHTKHISEDAIETAREALEPLPKPSSLKNISKPQECRL